jgi:V/A-type H+-transporting ATPase subunit F
MFEQKTQDARYKTQDRRQEEQTLSLESRVLSPESSSIAMIGDRDSILGFKALGVAVFPVNTKDESVEALKEIAKSEFKVAFITEQMAPGPEEISTIVGDRVFPVVTMIPSNRGSTGLALQRIQALVRKAAGADVM